MDRSQFREPYVEANERLKSAPATVTDEDITVLDAVDGNERQARQKRDAAIAAKAIQQAMTAPRERAAPSRSRSEVLRSAEQLGEQLAGLCKDMLDLELADDVFYQRLDDWMNKAQELKFEAPANTVLLLLLEAVRKINCANGRRNERIFGVEGRVADLEANTENTENTAKGVGGVRWGGVYEPNHEYQSGELCTCDGNLWVVTCDATSARPGADPSSWQLVLRRGKA